MLKVLFVTSEAFPFAKTGGLGDVAFALPKELKKQGIDVRVLMPKYKDIDDNFKRKMTICSSCTVKLGWRNQSCGIEGMEYHGIPFYFIDNEYYYNRDGLYGFHDDHERFLFLCTAVMTVVENIDFIPDIIHCNDWHSGMICPLIKEYSKNKTLLSDVQTIFTIHNLRYQGNFPKNILEDMLNLDLKRYYKDDALKSYGNISFMKAGINYADLVTTVSKTYAKEIQTKHYGEGLNEVLKAKRKRLYGITNGIDYKIFDPKIDNNIFDKYDIDTLEKKKENKAKLQGELRLPKKISVPLIGMVTRLVGAKGIDLIIDIIDELMSKNIQLVILGKGDPIIESKLKSFAKKYSSKLSVNILYDESLAHKIYAASDMFLMPSMFEPCGLAQLIALRYGTIPIVRETGGLKDTVKNYDEVTREGNGFSFSKCNSQEMFYAINRALKLYEEKGIWNRIIKNGMKEDNSWEKSAKIYKKLYEKLIADKSMYRVLSKGFNLC
ncbi:glycogen synthase GlgA [Wukongibacter baidiensis]|uniref:glycogen synthase GlgA n=1 Tax=Wukongibacter baidiensis TaxID=1723361 RepID=UPI003D7F5CE5